MFGEFKTLREHLGNPRRRSVTFEGIDPAAAFLADMLPRVGTDCDENGPNVTPAHHWQGAKRRYGLKDNQTCRLLYLARLDPEARHRRNPWLPLPTHIELWLGVADYLCGKLAGVEDIQADDLVMSGGVLDECEVLAFAKAHFA